MKRRQERHRDQQFLSILRILSLNLKHEFRRARRICVLRYATRYALLQCDNRPKMTGMKLFLGDYIE
jgi:hypothetical protein